MGMAADYARVLLERAFDALLELAYPQHLRVHPDELVVVQLSHLRFVLLKSVTPRRPRTGPASSRRRAETPPRSGGCGAPRRAPRLPTVRCTRRSWPPR